MTSQRADQPHSGDLDETAIGDGLTREQLYAMVWEQPMLRIAERLGVSSSYMARICTELRVPRPARGYWAKLEHGQQPTKPLLPPAEPGDVTTWHRGQASLTMPPTTVKQLAPRPSRKRGARRQAVAGAHALVASAKSQFLSGRSDDAGLLRPTKKLLVDLVVSKALLDEAISSADQLFRSIEMRGHRVVLAHHNSGMHRAQLDVRETPAKNRHTQSVWSPMRPTIAFISGVPVGLTLFEMTEDIEAVYVKGEYLPVRTLTAVQRQRFTGPHHWTTTLSKASGRFCLQAYSPDWRVKWVKQWRETKPGSLQAMVRRIVSELEGEVPTLARQMGEAETRAALQRKQWEEERELQRLEAECAKRAKARTEAQNDLLTAIKQWDEAKRIQAYFNAVEHEAALLGEAERARILDRIREARRLAGPVDALAVLTAWRTPDERG